MFWLFAEKKTWIKRNKSSWNGLKSFNIIYSGEGGRLSKGGKACFFFRSRGVSSFINDGMPESVFLYQKYGTAVAFSYPVFVLRFRDDKNLAVAVPSNKALEKIII